ncbi:ribonuclease CAF1 [Absidia repens]|uniref:Ribonuclease CAF1 n=1 Tax=Absidia repens TaxID=90262 RepID=A0A1X2IIJ6_9FUNG|nr:ribonuclease CAF1 [Absidia repens]
MPQKKTSLPMAFTEVTGENIHGLVEPILDTIRQAQYIAVDTEFSGHCPTIAKHMDQRYRSLAQVIRTHTLFSFGLTAIFDQSANGSDNCRQPPGFSYQFTNLEFLTRNQNTFEVDPNNIKFLAENGLDFGRIFQHGIPFSSSSNDPSGDGDNNGNNVMRQLWQSILKIIRDKSIPIIVHNGLLDIMYIYQSFFASLPENLSNFVADLVEMFPAGIYDTKYLATTVASEPKSFLAYLYCKYHRLHQRDDSSDSLSNTLILPPLSSSLPSPPSAAATDKKTSRPLDDSNDTPSMKRRKRAKKFDGNKASKTGICGHYSQHGWCKSGKQCSLSHDLEIILDHDLGMQQLPSEKSIEEEDSSEQKPTVWKNNSTGEDRTLTNATMEENEEDWISTPRRDHSAHFDAYMTAFIFCHFLSTMRRDEMSTHINKLNLMRMEIPLRLEKSHYAKPSAEWTRIKSQLWP